MLKIIEKMSKKLNDNMNNEGVTIAFLGESVTQGCFEIYRRKNGYGDTVYDKMHSYQVHLSEIFALLYPNVPVNIINAGINGDTVTGGYLRIERDILRHQPDLVVVSYGINDCCTDSDDSLEVYTEGLEKIFSKLQNVETIFMTPNMMNTNISDFITDAGYIEHAKFTAMLQNEGKFDNFIECAVKLCKKYNIYLCDCYKIWKKLYQCGINTTELLANKINHPTREMNKLFAIELVRTMIFEN